MACGFWILHDYVRFQKPQAIGLIEIGLNLADLSASQH